MNLSQNQKVGSEPVLDGKSDAHVPVEEGVVGLREGLVVSKPTVAISIDNNFRAHSASEAGNWKRNLYLIPGDAPRVVLDEQYGPGTPMPAYHQHWLHLTSLPKNVADATPVSVFLSSDEAQERLFAMMEGFEKRWDGSNYVGHWPAMAHSFEPGAPGIDRDWSALAEVAEGCPTFSAAEDWFTSWPYGLSAGTSDEDLESFAETEMGSSQEEIPTVYLDFDDVRECLAGHRERLRKAFVRGIETPQDPSGVWRIEDPQLDKLVREAIASGQGVTRRSDEPVSDFDLKLTWEGVPLRVTGHCSQGQEGFGDIDFELGE